MTYSDRVAERRAYERRNDALVAAIYGAAVFLAFVSICLTVLTLVATGAV